MLTLPYLHHAWCWFKVRLAPKLFWFLFALTSCVSPVFSNTKVQQYEKGIYDDCFVDGGSTCTRCYEYGGGVYCVFIQRR